MTPEDVRALRKAIAALDAKLAEYTKDDHSVEESAELLLELNLAKRDMGFLYDGLSTWLGGQMDGNQIMGLRDMATVERKMSSSRSGWRHKDLARDVIGRIEQSSVDMDTGEVVITPTEMALRILDYVQPSYWRVGELNKIGLNPDNYCAGSESKISIIVRRGDAK
jgi:hypothetical protein|tara:strand:- start:1268 stop:1765 length:498 start_codon:yes stop_codon:yes gene_type:complete